MARRTKLSEQLREVIRTCGLTRYRISKELGFSEATLSRFMHRKAGLSMETLDRLGELLRLRLVCEKRSIAREK